MKLQKKSMQALLSMVKFEITHQEGYIVECKEISKYWYDLSDKADENTKYSFEMYNSIRDDIKEAKERVKKLARISKELKQSLK
jgi:Asp-tRNA(Asn)/Glu-tRNA(Gln) amidotransferase C subunit